MRLLVLCFVLLLSGCLGSKQAPKAVDRPSIVPADQLTPCQGYTGPTPATEGQFVDAAFAEKRGRVCANGKLKAIEEILNPK